ncbi:MAG: SDR family NAD(P)-dependent oxidoreductase [Hyphomonadaceae bacterium]|nr:SDR family NAD(P)-dependent oxidoreductase [Hyphomonadaceae bacterium]
MRIVMTGGTSGIGLVAARALLKAGHALTVGARDPARAPADLRRGATFLPLDLGDLASVRAFADAAGAGADVLLFNAGIQVVSDQRTAQGFEVTFATNHLAHLALLHRLAPGLAPHGRVVLTASGVHDPEAKTGMPPPFHADARRLAFPENDPQRDAAAGMAGRRAYCASKLCNVMTGRELARRLAPGRPDVSVATFDPGFNPGTGLARDYGPAAQFVFRHVMGLVVRGENVTRPAISGAALATLAVDPAFAGARGAYFSMRRHRLTEVAPSTLARDDAACAALWTDSGALLRDAGFADLAEGV